MSRSSIVRRLTAAVALVAVLAAAAPALAAPAGRPVSAAVLGPGLLQRFVAWVESLWAGQAPSTLPPVEKGGPAPSSEGETLGQGLPLTTDASINIDPNG